MRQQYSAFYQRMQSALKKQRKDEFCGFFFFLRRDSVGVPDGSIEMALKTRGGYIKGTITSSPITTLAAMHILWEKTFYCCYS